MGLAKPRPPFLFSIAKNKVETVVLTVVLPVNDFVAIGQHWCILGTFGAARCGA
jgi:hypothetical protein